MNILTIVGSPRKGKATDILVDKAIQGVKAKTVGDLYAGGIEHRGIEYYFYKAIDLGKKP